MALVEYKVVQGIGYITLNRPDKLNAITDEMALEFSKAMFDLDEDDDAFVGIISGSGRAFCSGADVQQRQLGHADDLNGKRKGHTWDGVVQTPFFRSTRSKPVIAAVHGYAYGAGLRIALYSDLVVASKGAKFQITEVPRGISGSHFWMHLINRGASGFASEVALTGRVWTAEEGLQVGLVNRLAESDQHLEVATALAAEIMKNPPLAVRAVVEARRASIEQVDVRAYAMRPKNLHQSQDFKESAIAFLEKRPPVFLGR
jgi:enoyl-CoA hydratase/carnithine racemase